MFKRASVILLFFVSFFSVISAQPDGKILATVGGSTITERDFKTRFELSPFLSHKNGWNKDSLKADFLYSLIAEKLWYLEAVNQGVDLSEEFRFYFRPLEDLFLRDALFKMEVESKIKLSAADVNNALVKAAKTIKTSILSSPDKKLIEQIYSSLASGKKLDSLIKLPEFSSIQIIPMELKLGVLQDEEIEDSVFALNPGKSTQPINSENGWIIFHIDNVIFQAVDIAESKVVDKIKQTVKDRRALHRMKEYLSGLLAEYKINIDGGAFHFVADDIFDLISALPPAQNDSTGFKYILTAKDFQRLRASLRTNRPDSNLFIVDGREVTVFDFLASLALEEPEFKSQSKIEVFKRLSKLAKDFVQHQLLTFQAEKKGLKSLKSVTTDLESWKQNLLAQVMKVSFLDSARVSDAEIEDYYRQDVLKDKDFVLVNIQLLTVKDLNEIEVVLNETGKGKSFGDILKSRGKTDPLVNENGETGLKPAVFLGDIGIIASKLDLNQLYGPIKRGDGYSLIMVTAKSSMNDSLKFEYENSKEQLRTYLFQKKLNKFLSNKTAGLAQKYNAKAFESELKDIKTSNIVMFVHRLMGFGGRITAVPLLDNWADFIDINQLRQELIP
ncbi:MAG: hypothetical protein IPG53_10155 [Ignavibacteriales bacterium]|nr:hypothetical protein [Ignavibacteriales bacterium]